MYKAKTVTYVWTRGVQKNTASKKAKVYKQVPREPPLSDRDRKTLSRSELAVSIAEKSIKWPLKGHILERNSHEAHLTGSLIFFYVNIGRSTLNGLQCSLFVFL